MTQYGEINSKLTFCILFLSLVGPPVCEASQCWVTSQGAAVHTPRRWFSRDGVTQEACAAVFGQVRVDCDAQAMGLRQYCRTPQQQIEGPASIYARVPVGSRIITEWTEERPAPLHPDDEVRLQTLREQWEDWLNAASEETSSA